MIEDLRLIAAVFDAEAGDRAAAVVGVEDRQAESSVPDDAVHQHFLQPALLLLRRRPHQFERAIVGDACIEPKTDGIGWVECLAEPGLRDGTELVVADEANRLAMESHAMSGC